MVKLIVPGRSRGLAPEDETSEIFSDLLKVEVSETIEIEDRLFDRIARSARGEGEPVDTGKVEVDIDDDTLVEIQLTNDVKIWISAAQARKDFAGHAQRSGEQAFHIPPAFNFGRSTRGLGDWVLKGLRFLNIQPDEAIAKKGAKALAEKLEAKIGREEGLYRFENPDQVDPVPFDPDAIPDGQEILVLIHGTASMTGASFLGLTQQSDDQKRKGEPPVWQQLVDRYDGHIYGFEHRTLSESPITNAINLVKVLPKNVRLHMVGFSRGGIIGELIARIDAKDIGDDGKPMDRAEPFDEIDLDFFGKWRGDPNWEEDNPKDAKEIRARRAADKAALEELNVLLKDHQPIIERFVRVGCPASGTTLASGRLDLYLSIIVNLIGAIPFLKDNPFYELTTAILQAFVKMRTDPRVIPGLEAQMPESPLINMLNRTDVQVAGPLCVIAGDIQPSGILHSLKVFATDMYYWDEHDLVVKTNEMLGGAARAGGIRYFFDKGSQVNHFSYFSNARTASRMFDALGGDVSNYNLYQKNQALRPAARGEIVQRDRSEVPTVFVLPGIMGSNLKEKNNRLWLHYRRLAFGAIETLADLGNADIGPDGPIDDYYADLIAHLSKDHFVIPFAYDWRKPIKQEALRLANEVDDAMLATTQPIRFIAHSMGGLVVRTMMATRPNTWRDVKARDGARFVMLGTPNGGSHAIVTQLVGRAGTINKLHTLDITHSKREVLGFIHQIPGVLQLLPDGGEKDFFDVQPWETLHKAYSDDWEVPNPLDLRAARKIRKVLAGPASRDDEVTCYVAGKAAETPIDLVPDTTVFGRRRLKILSTPQGDGQVPWSTGIIDDSRTWYADADHGTLSSHRPDFPAYTELLETGKTSRLPKLPSPGKRGAPRYQEMSETALEAMSSDEFHLMPMGGAAWQPKTTDTPKATVEIHHANLAFCGELIAVGHYQNDLLMSAEKYIDHRLDNRLTTRRALGVYPGALDTADVLFSLSEYKDDFKGALIVGLGQYGQLTIETLTRTLANAFLHYALEMCEKPDREGDSQLSLGTLLIGHSESRLTLRQSLRATLDAFIRANGRIDQINREDPKMKIDPIARLKLVELYEDTAIKTASILMSEQHDTAFTEKLDIRPHLQHGRGGLRRASEDDSTGYLQRVQIEKSKVAGEENTLVFTSHSDYALAAQDLHIQDRRMVDNMIDDITSSTVRRKNVSQLLFEFLVPQGLKRFAADRRDMQFILDETAAGYPWELLDNKFSGSDRPIAVNTNFTRQLIQSSSVIGRFSAETRGVLVVGDPPSDKFQELHGAQEEARIVADIFNTAGSWGDVSPLIQPDAGTVFEEILLGARRIMHLAGHGVYEHGDDRHTGMVLGNDVFLSPQTIKSLSHPPEFVFLNCCYLGKIARVDDERTSWLHRHRLAANLGVAFMQAGAKAVIAAGWEVDDAPAKEFAATFYEQMVRFGASFADAVRMGREAAYTADPTSNTWGAYQCYGDASYRFRSDTGGQRSNSGPDRFAAKAQVINAITNISQLADASNASDGFSARLDEIVAEVSDEWRSDAQLNDALGAAYGNLGRFEDAIAAYDLAIKANKASYSVRAVEQRANLRARVAGLEVIAAEKSGKNVSATMKRVAPKIEKTIEELEGLASALRESDTVERLRLIASAYKRKCLTETFKASSHFKDLVEMCEYYLLAYSKSVGGGDANSYDADPAINAFLAIAMLKHYPGRSKPVSRFAKQIDDLMTQAEHSLPSIGSIMTRLQNEADATQSFWEFAMIGDAMLVEHLLAGNLTAGQGSTTNADKVIAAYERAWVNGGHSRDLSSVIETVDFLWIMLDRLEGANEEGQQERDALKRIGQALERLAAARG